MTEAGTKQFSDADLGVRYPHPRLELRTFLEVASDAEKQRLAWLGSKDVPPTDPTGFDDGIHVIFDQCVMEERGPAALIGEVLKTKNEADLLEPIVELLSRMISVLGDSPAKAYVAHPSWAEVMTRAKVAYDEMSKPTSGEG